MLSGKIQLIRVFSALLALVLCVSITRSQQSSSMAVTVIDERGAVIGTAAVALIDKDGNEKKRFTNDIGVVTFNDLIPGKYTLKVTSNGFAEFTKTDLNVGSGNRTSVSVKLSVTIENQQATVTANNRALNTDPESNASGIVLKGQDLDALPENPEELAYALRALAGPGAGPNGGQMTVDGFTAGRLPQKQEIREIQVNVNPFSAENDRLGFGRIDVFTKPGGPQFHGSAAALFNDRGLNSRNPFAPVRGDYQARVYGGNLSGPLVRNRASFTVFLQPRNFDDVALVNATVLDPAFRVIPFAEQAPITRRFLDGSGRVDYQVNKNNTFRARYSVGTYDFKKDGIGQFSLPSRSYDTHGSEHSLQLTETSILSATLVNETRFQYSRGSRDVFSDNESPALLVLDSFIGGGPQVGITSNTAGRWEIRNYTSIGLHRHSLKVGARLRGVQIDDLASSNFGGTFTFSGGTGPALDAANRVIRDQSGRPVQINISSIERYRRTLLFQQQGLTPAEIRESGGGASLLSLAAGNPEAKVSQIDVGAFLQDDWRIRPTFTLSFGLRYEAQTNLSDSTNFAPRFAFAWSPVFNRSKPPTTVIRGGFGIFYDRFSEGLTLQANRFNGVNQRQFVIADPRILDLFPAVPAASSLESFATPQTVLRVAGDLVAPYTIQASLSVERQMPHNFTLAATVVDSRIVHFLRSRNINAPLPGSRITDPATVERPFGNIGNIFEYESSGILKQSLLAINAYNRGNKHFTVFASYILSKTESDSDGAGTFPANSYDLRDEFGRASFDVRHRLFFGGTVNLPRKITLNPLIILSSSLPFNVVSGIDSNGDTLFTDRPSVATDLSRPSVRITGLGAFDLNPLPGQQIIRRNFGNGPATYLTNIRISRTFPLGPSPKAKGATPGAAQRGDSPYKLTVSVAAWNLLNRTNASAPIGNLSSPLFGRSTALATGAYGISGSANAAANRRIDIEVRFTF